MIEPSERERALLEDGSRTANDELFLMRLRYKEGRLIEAGANRPFLLDDPSYAYIVYSGFLDVFTVMSREGVAPVGPRRHLLRLSSGQACFGVDFAKMPDGRRLMAPPDGLRFLAVGTVGTRVLRVPRERLASYGEQPLFKEQLCALIDTWIEGLSASLTDELPPKSALTLEPGGALELATGSIVTARREVTWTTVDDGGLTLLGDPELIVKTGAMLPLVRGSWAVATSPSALHGAGTSSQPDTIITGGALDRFHALAIVLLARMRMHRDEHDAARAGNRARSDQRTLARAYGQLAGALEDGRAIRVATGERESPLFLAAQLVGDATGVEMVPVRNLRPGATPEDVLTAIARASRVQYRAVSLVGDWWRRDNGPLLAFNADAHPVALLPKTPRSYVLVDPQAPEPRPVTRDLARTLDTTAYMFYRPLPERPMSIRGLLGFGLRGHRDDLLMILGTGLAGGLLVTLTPLVTKALFDRVIPSGEQNRLFQLTAALLVGAIASLLFELTRGIAVLRLVSRMDGSLQAAVWDRLLALPVPFFRKYSTGDLTTRALSINAIRQLLTSVAVSAVLGVVFSVFNIILLFYYSWVLALLGIGLVATIIAVTLILSAIQVRRRRPLISMQAAINGLVVQLISGIAKLRVTGAEGRAFAAWAKMFAEQRRVAVHAGRITNYQQVFDAAAPVVTTLAIFSVIAWQLRPNISSGDFLGFNAAFGQFLTAMLTMNAAFITLLNVVPYLEQMTPILQTLPEVDRSKSSPGELSGDIEVSHVSFRYSPDGPLVLNDLSLKIRAGEFVAIVGPSGSGKSSLLRLLLKFEDPESGAIYYDGQDMDSLDVQAVRRQIGVVLQNGKLMPGAIFTNIIGSTGRSLDDAWEAARLAGIEDDIRKMPMGMHTVVSHGGATFSGGQRQRMLIARAIVTRPRILFLDEATSALDSRTQENVSASLASLQATRIVIAHRLSTIVNADCIYVLKDGRIAQSGTYQELVRQPGPFADLVRRQLT